MKFVVKQLMQMKLEKDNMVKLAKSAKKTQNKHICWKRKLKSLQKVNLDEKTTINRNQLKEAKQGLN